MRNELRRGERGAGEEAAFLNVVAGEHGEIGDGELEIGERGGDVGEDGAIGEDRKRRRRNHGGFEFRSLSLSLCLWIGRE